VSLSRVGGSSVAATSIAIPAHVAGDLIVIWAYRDGSTTPPTVPAAAGTVPAFTTIDGPVGANSCAAVCAWAVATGTTDTSGTWTNATGLSVEVWRGAGSPPIGGHAQSGASVASGGNIAIPAITPTDASGNSVILAFAGWQTVTAWNAAPAGYTQRSQVATECEALSKNSTTADGAFNVSGTASATGGTRTQQIEILADLGNRISQDGIEVVRQGNPNARTSQLGVEVVHSAPASVKNRLSQFGIEVVRSAPGVTITLTDSGALVLVADLPALLQVLPTAGELDLAADDATTFPVQPDSGVMLLGADAAGFSLDVQAGSGVLVLAGDDASVTFVQLDSAVVVLAGDAPALGLVQLASARLMLAADAPLIGPLAFAAAVLKLVADAPTLYPFSPASGKLALAGDVPNIVPLALVGARLLLAGAAATMYPVNMDAAAQLLLAADLPTWSHDFRIVMFSAGQLLLRSDPPIVTPLAGPATGTGLSLSGAF
jgi:hypothetical protein